MIDAFIYDGIRTPFGRHSGTLSPVRADDLLGNLVGALVERSPFDGAQFEDVVAGCTNQAGEDCRNVARRAGLLAGLPVEVGGITVNRLCASSLEAVNMAAQKVASGWEDMVVAGGVESMSRIPMGSDGGAWAMDPAVETGPIAPESTNGATMMPCPAPQYTRIASVTTLSTSSGELVLTLPRMTQCDSRKASPNTIRAIATESSARSLVVIAPKCALSEYRIWI